MKYVLVLLVVVVGLWLLMRPRSGSGPADPPKPRRPRRGKPPAQIVACAHCDLRLPQDEAVAGRDHAWFCSEAHRLAGPR